MFTNEDIDDDETDNNAAPYHYITVHIKIITMFLYYWTKTSQVSDETKKPLIVLMDGVKWLVDLISFLVT